MGYPTKIQYIKRKSGNDQYCVNLPMALGRAMNFQAGEEVEWVISREGHLVLVRSESIERLSLPDLAQDGGGRGASMGECAAAGKVVRRELCRRVARMGVALTSCCDGESVVRKNFSA